jgi:hypothetical protein
MMHRTRTFQVYDVISAEDLADKLTAHTWTCCIAFRFCDLLFLNDSTSGDGAQEYAVVRHGQQIESITFGWCDEAKALGYIRALRDGTLGEAYAVVTNRIETPRAHGRCHHCA